jgi:hypothetical protein
MEPAPRPDAERRNAKLLATALRGGLWAEAGWKSRIGMVLLWIGAAGMPLAFLADPTTVWLWFGAALFAAFVGLAALFFRETFIPQEHGPY